MTILASLQFPIHYNHTNIHYIVHGETVHFNHSFAIRLEDLKETTNKLSLPVYRPKFEPDTFRMPVILTCLASHQSKGVETAVLQLKVNASLKNATHIRV